MREFNPEYNYEDQKNLDYIHIVESYSKYYKTGNLQALNKYEAQVLNNAIKYQAGESILSPWGKNTVLEVELGDFESIFKVVKSLIINPKNLLSLQKHRGREESWRVIKGELTVILNQERITKFAGEKILIAKGDIHCIANLTDEILKIEEVQLGDCREADNIRLCDFNNRPTFPAENPKEMKSVELYKELMKNILE